MSGIQAAAEGWSRSGQGGRGIHSPVENFRRARSLAAQGTHYPAYAACQHGEARITWCFWFQRDPVGEAAGRIDKSRQAEARSRPRGIKKTQQCPRKKGRSRSASGPSLGRKRPRRAAGTRRKSHYRAATICHRVAQKASAAGIFSSNRGRRVVAYQAALGQPGKRDAASSSKSAPRPCGGAIGGVVRPNQKPRGLFHDGSRFCRVC